MSKAIKKARKLSRGRALFSWSSDDDAQLNSDTDRPRPIKVLHVAQTAKGGVGSYLEEIVALQVQRHGKESVRLVLPEEHAACFPGLEAAAAQNFPADGGGRLGSSLRMAVQAVRVVRQWQPDIVHLHSTYAGIVMRPLLALLPRAPKIVYCAHGWAFDRKQRVLQARLIGLLERLLSRLCTAVVCVSGHDALRAAAVGISAHRLKVVLNGIGDALPLPRDEADAFWPGKRLRILFVGRLDSQKGADVLFAAMRRLGDAAFAVVVGSAVVADTAAGPDPPSNVKVVGWMAREAIARLYASADMLVMPSRWEGLPLVMLEAMRAGLPIVATRVGGLPEVVQDGITGRLVDAEDPAQLAEAVIATSGPVRREMGQRARERFLQMFRIERVVEELDAVYLSAVGQVRLAD